MKTQNLSVFWFHFTQQGLSVHCLQLRQILVDPPRLLKAMDHGHNFTS